MAEACTQTDGRCPVCCSHCSRAWVVPTRLSSSTWRRAAVQGGPTTRAPARLTMASMRSAAAMALSADTHRTPAPSWRAACAGWRLQTVTVWPAATSLCTRAWPMNPVPPVIKTCMLEMSLCLRLWGRMPRPAHCAQPEVAGACAPKMASWQAVFCHRSGRSVTSCIEMLRGGSGPGSAGTGF